MDKRVASNIIKMLDKVPVQGHADRAAMNEACDTLLEIVNAPDEPDTGKDGKTDT